MNDVNPHLALWQSETYVSTTELKWEAYVDAVAKCIGLTGLDGDTDKDGYSLDQAHDLFVAGCSVMDCAQEFLHQMDELPAMDPAGPYSD